MYKKRR